jgi:hypothetical protein
MSQTITVRFPGLGFKATKYLDGTIIVEYNEYEGNAIFSEESVAWEKDNLSCPAFVRRSFK